MEQNAIPISPRNRVPARSFVQVAKSPPQRPFLFGAQFPYSPHHYIIGIDMTETRSVIQNVRQAAKQRPKFPFYTILSLGTAIF